MGIYMWDELKTILEYGFESAMGFWDKVLRIGLPLLHLTMMALLFTSGYFLARVKKTGIIFYYVLFPLRLLTLTLTFGFLLKLMESGGCNIFYKAVLTLTIALEFLRLLFMIWIHRALISEKHKL